MEIALACDLIVAARGAKLGIPEAKRSLVAAGGALLRLPRRIPYHVVMELALTGDPMPAERFYELGLVNRLSEPGEAVEVALELAETLAQNGPLALIASKRILQEQFDWSSSEMWQRQGEITAPVMASEDAKEGASAFKEKRDPVWRGKVAAERWPAATAVRASSRASAREALAPALAQDVAKPSPQRPHQRSPGALRGYWEIGSPKVDRGRHDAVLFVDVRRRVALAGAGPLGTSDVAEVDAVGHDLHQPGEHVSASAHVARLLLHPHDLAQLGIAVDQLQDLAFRERVEQLHARHR